MKICLALLCLCVSNLLFSQTFHFKIIDPIICYDYVNKKIIAIEDSSYRLEITPCSKKAIKKPLYWDKQVSFQGVKSSFVPLSSKGSPIYFVDRGCGWVLQLRNDSIVRVDQSFHHQNQFGGAFFMHNGTPHIFGGYGLFSYKNFITKYDKDLRQWYLENEGGEFLYRNHKIFGFTDSKINVLLPKNDNVDFSDQLWQYSFKSNKWRFLGSVQGIDSLASAKFVVSNNNLIIGYDCLYEFDFEKHVINRYKLQPINTVLNFFRFPHTYGVLKQVLDENKKESIFSIYKQGVFIKNFRVSSTEMNVDQEDIFNIHNSWFILIGGLICLVLLLIVFFKRKVNHRGELSQNVLELLNLWLSKPGYLLELSELNDLVNYDNPAPDTIKKRRENLIRIFALEVSKVYQIPLNKLYDTIPHPSDKRMKLLRLSNNLVQRIKKVN